jgi:hypothetical protein
MDVTLTIQICCLWKELGVTLVLHSELNDAWHRRILGVLILYYIQSL